MTTTDRGYVRLAHATVPVLAVLGTLLLGASTAIELGDAQPRVEIWVGAAAGTAFLIAVIASRGSDAQVLATRARLLVGAGLSALLAVAALWQATERTAPRVLLLLIPVCLLFTTAGLALREAAVLRREARLREMRSRMDGEEGERRRWVRELHDETLQDLAVVHVLLGTAATSGDGQVQAKGITDARAMIGQQIQALRRLISAMRPLSLDTLGLGAALEDLARRAGDMTGIEVDVFAEELPRLPAEAETATYRIVQEALTNAVRHSGARRITIEARPAGDCLEVAVRDDGHGAPAAFDPGYGLLGMRERAETVGAELRITGPENGGTLVALRLPLGV
jgi:signal transduction histidine kinase